MIERSTMSIMAVKTVIMIVQIHNGARREVERVRRKGDTVRVKGGYSGGTVGYSEGTLGHSEGSVGVQWD